MSCDWPQASPGDCKADEDIALEFAFILDLAKPKA